MRQVGADQHQIAIAVLADMIADEALAARVERQRQLEFGVMMPLEGDAVVELAVEPGPGGAGRLLQLFGETASSGQSGLRDARKVSELASRRQQRRPALP